MIHQKSMLNDLHLALSVTVLSSTTGLAVAAVVPPIPHFWEDPRFLAPILSALVNAVWLLFRIWRRRQLRKFKLDGHLAEAQGISDKLVKRIQFLEDHNRLLERENKRLKDERLRRGRLR